jgi:hypothetical protein
MPSCVSAPIVVRQKKGAPNRTAVSKILFNFRALFADAVPLEQFDGAPVPIRFGKSGVPPGSAGVPENCVDFGQLDVGCGEPPIEAYCFEQQPERFLAPPLDPVELREILVRHRVSRFAGDPFALLADVAQGFVLEGEIDYFFAPEGHLASLVRLWPDDVDKRPLPLGRGSVMMAMVWTFQTAIELCELLKQGMSSFSARMSGELRTMREAADRIDKRLESDQAEISRFISGEYRL